MEISFTNSFQLYFNNQVLYIDTFVLIIYKTMNRLHCDYITITVIELVDTFQEKKEREHSNFKIFLNYICIVLST